MKNILFKKQTNKKKRTKILSICQKNKDKNCETTVNKKFVYNVVRSQEVSPQIESPHLYIKKSFDTKTRTERFIFQAKGSFTLTHNRIPLLVRFHHTLDIEIVWKSKAFSPKKSEVLT